MQAFLYLCVINYLEAKQTNFILGNTYYFKKLQLLYNQPKYADIRWL